VCHELSFTRREVGADDSLDTGTIFGVRVRPGDYPELVKVAALSLEDGKFSYTRLGEEGISAIFPLSMLRNLPNLVTAQVTIQLQLKGFTDSLTSGEISGVQAVGESLDAIRRGDAPVVLAGSADDLLDPFSFGAALASGWVRAEGGGVLLGQGAAALVLEDASHAAAAGRSVLAEVLAYEEGFGSCDDPSVGSGVIRRALHAAGLGPEEVGSVWLDACGICERDSAWEEALGQVFRELHSPPALCGQASRMGHLGTASGGAEAVFAVEALRRGELPPGRLQLPGSGLPPASADGAPGEVALVLSGARTGTRGALVLRKGAA